ncbi:oxidoreductase, aldo/keto reductase family protein [Oceanicola granulosus HTCC2516]|uniref:Oxidoreductase, aldo/keto reductase family protein n=1 Tax=Oceanicola granulosus (strain ATCC BAA-861 / DSM 15982 / KCTC 12143 / HTCC2516) TaxID=314256 RepID=Q2CA80_OCEGH|nr:aldo/keto reductase [Oceanicola granulosus]EAR49565.1 oxidoreductase, aldo/keto reductase family protein [Oceanicola granulosus HTCC2516]
MTQTYKTLSGRPLSALTFGTMQFGGNADAAESRAMYDAARAAGINHFDTAVGYTDGASEEVTGRLIAHERGDVFLATKVAYAGGAGRDNIRTQFDQSRRQLGHDSVDLLYIHRFHPESDPQETFSTLAEMQEQGLVRHIGVSNYAAWQVMKAQAVAHALGTRIDAIQPMYSLVKRQAEVELFPMCDDQGIGIHAYSPLGGGLLTGKYTGGGTGRLTENEMYRKRYAADIYRAAAEKLGEIAAEAGAHPATLAVAWAAAHPARPSPIISARSLEQLRPSLAAVDYRLDDTLYDRLAALVPAPPKATDRAEEA